MTDDNEPEGWRNAGRLTKNSKYVNYRLPTRLYNRLVEFAVENETTQSAVIREAIKEFMSRHRRRGRKGKTANNLFD